jgi:hypothetical protein
MAATRPLRTRACSLWDRGDEASTSDCDETRGRFESTRALFESLETFSMGGDEGEGQRELREARAEIVRLRVTPCSASCWRNRAFEVALTAGTAEAA